MVAAPTGISQTLYSPPGFGVSRNGINWTGVDPLAGLKVPLACGQGPAAPAMTPPITCNWRHTALSCDSKFAPLGSVTWK
jgi:hypothetical protein